MKGFLGFLPERPETRQDYSLFYLMKNGEQIGPLKVKEIVKKVRNTEINIFDYIFSSDQLCWVRIKDLKIFKPLIPRKPEVIHPSSRQNEDIEVIDTKSGTDIFLDRNSPSDTDVAIEITTSEILCCSEGGKSVEVSPPFSVEKRDKEPQSSSTTDAEDQSVSSSISKVEYYNIKKIIPERVHLRVPFSGSAEVHYENKSYHGSCVNISEDGCFIKMSLDIQKKEAMVLVKIKSDMGPFNITANARIISVRTGFNKGYGMQFIDLNPDTKSQLSTFVNECAKST